MPVSHIGLTVSHIPSATSFYLAALQPLGYRFIGNQGDSIGFGVDSADFFITQASHGRISPNHIAFLADSHLIVQECYAAALKAGGFPNGAPEYRNDDCSCYNAAVEDPDGNTIEFIFRQPHTQGQNEATAPSPYSRASTWQHGVDGVEQSTMSRGSQAPKSSSRVKSRVKTAVDLASATSKSMKPSRSEAPSGLKRSVTEPVKNSGEPSSKAFLGTMLGAAAGVAIAFAMAKSEGENARDEAGFSSKATSRRATETTRPSASRADTLPASIPHSSGLSRRNSQRSSHKPQRLAIESAPWQRDTDTNGTFARRAEPHRSQTYDAVAYAAISSSRVGRNDPSPGVLKRATTLPTEYDIVDHADRYSDVYKAGLGSRQPTTHRSSRRNSYDSAGAVSRHDSAISMRSSRSHHGRHSGSDSGHRSSASTLKPSPRRTFSQRQASLAAGAAVVLPPSRAGGTKIDGTSSRYPAVPSPFLPPEDWAQQAAADAAAARDESDGLGDLESELAPDDSISCVSLRSSRRRGSVSGHRHRKAESSSRYSEAPSERTLRPGAAGLALPFRTGRGDERDVRKGRGGPYF